MLLWVCCKAQIALFIVESEFICFLELFISDGIREVIRKSMLVKKKKANFTYYNLTVWDYIFSLRNKCSNVWKKKPKQQNSTLRQSSSLLMLSWNPELTVMAFNHPSGPRCRWEEQRQGSDTGRGFLSCLHCVPGVRLFPMQWVTQLGAAWRGPTLCWFCLLGFFV